MIKCSSQLNHEQDLQHTFKNKLSDVDIKLTHNDPNAALNSSIEDFIAVDHDEFENN